MQRTRTKGRLAAGGSPRPAGHRGRQVMELFAKVAHEQGTGVIVVTHDHRALDVFDRTYEMEDGRLTESTSGAIAAAKH